MEKNNKNKALELQIVFPTKKEVFSVEWIDVMSPTGGFVIGRDHSPLVSIIKDRSKLTYKKLGDQKTSTIDTYGGLIEVRDGVALVILD